MVKYPHAAIGELCRIEKGQTGLASATPGEYPLVATSAERKSCSSFQFDTEAVCIPLVSSTGHGKKTLNYVHFQKGKFALGTILAAVIPKEPKKLSAAFLHRYLQFYKDRKIVPLMKGAANVSLAVKDIAKIEIPVPPINEQKAFVELFNKLNDSSIKLQDEFSNQSDYLSLLRQAVLQEAVEGKLTADWRKKHPELISGENHAAALLDKIKAEKTRLIKEGKIKKEKPLPPVKEEEKPFDLPEGWVWCRLAKILSNSKYSLKAGPFGSSLTKSEYKDCGYKIYGQEQVISQDSFYGSYYIDEKKYQQLKSCAVSAGDILISLVGTIGKILILPENAMPGIINPRLIKISLHKLIYKKYFTRLYSSGCIQNQLKDNASGQTMDVISIKILSNVMFPIPPFAEQQAIVERVDKLMAKIDELEKQVSERKDQAEMLMQSVLRKAFGNS